MSQLLQPEHSGRLRPHAHTSYAGLGFLLLVAVIILGAIAYRVNADPGPVSGDVGVYAAVPQKVPGAPTITSPSSGQEEHSLPVIIKGTCDSGYITEVFANDILVGAAICAGGSYSVSIDLFYGLNTIRAQSFNVTNQASPSSAAIGLTFTPLGGPGINQFQSFGQSSPIVNQLYLKANVFFRLAKSGSDTTWPIEVVGGTAPYAVNVSWGDGKTDIYSRSSAGKFEITHRYDASSSGHSYPVVVRAADAVGDQAYLQVVSVSGVPTAAAKGTSGLAIAWPILGVAVLLVISFYLGDRYELASLVRRGKVSNAS